MHDSEPSRRSTDDMSWCSGIPVCAAEGPPAKKNRKSGLKAETATSWVSHLQRVFTDIAGQQLFAKDVENPVTLETLCSGIGTASLVLKVALLVLLATHACVAVCKLPPAVSLLLSIQESCRSALFTCAFASRPPRNQSVLPQCLPITSSSHVHASPLCACCKMVGVAHRELMTLDCKPAAKKSCMSNTNSDHHFLFMSDLELEEAHCLRHKTFCQLPHKQSDTKCQVFCAGPPCTPYSQQR